MEAVGKRKAGVEEEGPIGKQAKGECIISISLLFPSFTCYITASPILCVA